ncbi:MAG: NUDIX hydrolase [Bdellovibrionales bacterium]|nr:NUDIX hydrolase [Bdellovibrionales bacterium]
MANDLKDDPIATRWNLVGEKVFLDFPYLQIVERNCRRATDPADQEPHRFYVLRAKDWCNVIPVTEEGKLVLVKEFRAGILGASYEFPGGVVESTDADVTATALREMTEETGYELLPHARSKVLGSSFPNPALQDNRVHSLIVGPVKKSRAQNLDPMEDIEVVEIAAEDLPKLYREGKFDHALMLTTLFHFLMQETPAAKDLLDGLHAFARRE